MRLFSQRKRVAALEELSKQATVKHRENLSNIVETRKNVDKLNVVLKQNNIVLQLAHVIRYKQQ
jgi:hypothetical protein